MIYRVKKYHLELGLSCIILTLPFSNLVREMTQTANDMLTNLLMLCGFLLIINPQFFTKYTLYRINKSYWILCLFQMYILVAGVLKGVSFNGMIHTIFVIAIMIALATNNREINSLVFLDILFFVSGILSIVACYVLSHGFTVTNFTTSFSTSGEMIADRLTISSLTVICFVSCLSNKHMRAKHGILTAIFTLSSIYVLLLVTRRGKLIASAIMVLLYLLKYFVEYLVNSTKKLNLKRVSRNILFIIGISFSVYLIINKIPSILAMLRFFLSSVNNAVTTLVGHNVSQTDASAIIRYHLRQMAIGEYKNYTVLEYILGKGYAYRYLDFPLLQIFIDLGMIGGILFITYMVIYPIKFFLKRNLNELQMCVVLFCINAMVDIVYAGVPYGWDKYIYIIMAIYVFKYSNEKMEIIDENIIC